MTNDASRKVTHSTNCATEFFVGLLGHEQGLEQRFDGHYQFVVFLQLISR